MKGQVQNDGRQKQKGACSKNLQGEEGKKEGKKEGEEKESE